MIYLFSHIYSLTIIYSYEKCKKNTYLRPVLFLLIVIAISFLPGFQSNVGTDYNNYKDLYTGVSNLEFYYEKKEYFFYYFVRFLRYIDLGPQSLFLFISFLQAILLCNLLRFFSKEGFNLLIVFFLVACFTNMLHNQMNILRAYVAVYAFLNAYFYRSKGMFVKSLLFFSFGFFWHKSILALIPLLFLFERLWIFVFKNRVKIFLLTFLIFLSGIPLYFIDFFVDNFFSMYSHYLASDYAQKEIPYINVLTKFIYTPIYFLFFYSIRGKNANDFSSFFLFSIGVWLLSVNFYLLILHTPLAVRFIHFFVLFSIFPIYHVFLCYRKNLIISVSLYFYILLPYFFKVVVFPSREYHYISIFH